MLHKSPDLSSERYGRYAAPVAIVSLLFIVAAAFSSRFREDGQPGLRELYLQTLAGSVTGDSLRTPSHPMGESSAGQLMKQEPFDTFRRSTGADWPLYGLTMVGLQRLAATRTLLETCEREDVVGDFVECGVWRGGSSIFAKGVITSFGGRTRRAVRLFDSFSGLPRATSVEDSDVWMRMEYLQVSLEEVKSNFERFHLLDEHVFFYKGFFR